MQELKEKRISTLKEKIAKIIMKEKNLTLQIINDPEVFNMVSKSIEETITNIEEYFPIVVSNSNEAKIVKTINDKIFDSKYTIEKIRYKDPLQKLMIDKSVKKKFSCEVVQLMQEAFYLGVISGQCPESDHIRLLAMKRN